MAANKFTLHGYNVDISYIVGGNPTFKSFRYKDGSFSKDFTPAEIHIDATEVDQLVSVTLNLTVDAGATTFSVFLPTYDVPRGQTVEFNTVGVYKEVIGPVVLPLEQRTAWRTIHLHGTAETVIVPL
jgi:hypothetical protein